MLYILKVMRKKLIKDKFLFSKLLILCISIILLSISTFSQNKSLEISIDKKLEQFASKLNIPYYPSGDTDYLFRKVILITICDNLNDSLLVGLTLVYNHGSLDNVDADFFYDFNGIYCIIKFINCKIEDVLSTTTIRRMVALDELKKKQIGERLLPQDIVVGGAIIPMILIFSKSQNNFIFSETYIDIGELPENYRRLSLY